MINGTVSIKVVLNEIIRDLGIGDSHIQYHSFKEWIIEALKHIGVKGQFRQEIRTIEIKDYTGKLPCETYKVSELIDGYKYNLNPKLTIDDDAVDKEAEINDIKITNNDYNIQFREIQTSFKEGLMKFQLVLLPIDKNGYLLVPDSVSYKEALMWYVAYKSRIAGHEFKVRELNTIDYSYNKWNFYCKQARGVARMPDKELMEVLKNEFHRLIINPNSYDSNFVELGRTEHLNTDKNSLSGLI